MNDVPRAALAIVATACLLAAGLNAGCGSLRSKLGNSGSMGGAAGTAARGQGGAAGRASTGGVGGAVAAAGGGGGVATTGFGGTPAAGGGGAAGVEASGGRGGMPVGAGGAGGGPTGGKGGGAGAGGAPGAVNGTACKQNGQCASGTCVDGVCCNDVCGGQCEACDLAAPLLGICSVLPPMQLPHGTRAGCAGAGQGICGGACDGVKRNVCTYPSPSVNCGKQSCANGVKTRATTCDGAGKCDPVTTVTCDQGCAGDDCQGACTADVDCATSASGHYCDTDTHACTPLKPLGHACAMSSECTSNHCADGVCCNTDCTDQCAACAESGAVGRCQVITGKPRRSSCDGADTCVGKCDGQNKTCQYPGASTPCGTASCTNAAMTPVGACDGAGQCAQSPLPCDTAYCASGTACGTCLNDGQCGPGRWCDHATNGGTSTATKPNGAACSTATPGECASNHCVLTGAGTGVCCATDCSGSQPRCSDTGSACVCTNTSCTGSTVCDASTGGCCPLNPCYFTVGSCRSGQSSGCDPGCGLPYLAPNCGCTSTACCGNVCCVTMMCSNDTCTGTPVTTCRP